MHSDSLLILVGWNQRRSPTKQRGKLSYANKGGQRSAEALTKSCFGSLLVHSFAVEFACSQVGMQPLHHGRDAAMPPPAASQLDPRTGSMSVDALGVPHASSMPDMVAVNGNAAESALFVQNDAENVGVGNPGIDLQPAARADMTSRVFHNSQGQRRKRLWSVREVFFNSWK